MPKPLREVIGDRVERALADVAMSPADLARATGFSEATVSLVRAGRRSPSVELLVEMAKALEVSTDYLLGIK